jgi:hypothetical protein
MKPISPLELLPALDYEKDFLAGKRLREKKAVEYLGPYVDKTTAEFLAVGDYTVSYI